MSQKCYTLLHNGEIHFSAGVKHIPAKEFAFLLEGEELLNKVKEDAALYKQEVEKECEDLREKAKKEGFETGYSEWIEKIAELEKRITAVSEETHRMLLPITIKAAKKIVGQELETHPETIVNIIASSLQSVVGHKKITVHVNREELEQVRKEKVNLQKTFEKLEVFTIVPNDDVLPGGCIIETEKGIINAQIDNQWMILENALQKIWEQENPSPKEPPPANLTPITEKIKEQPPKKKNEENAVPKEELEVKKDDEELDDEDSDWDDEDSDWDDWDDDE